MIWARFFETAILIDTLEYLETFVKVPCTENLEHGKEHFLKYYILNIPLSFNYVFALNTPLSRCGTRQISSMHKSVRKTNTVALGFGISKLLERDMFLLQKYLN